MKMVKALLLGAAAGLAGVAGAQAADLPGKAAPASYVKICDTYGAGYYFIPGSSTCLKIGGYVRQHIYASQNYSGADSGPINFRTDFLVNFDARSSTEYGLLRSSASILMRRGPANGGMANGIASVGGGSGGNSGSTGDATLAVLANAFIQFGPVTAGLAPSFFNFYQNEANFVDNGSATFRASDTVTNLLAFTASFGGGFMATLSIEDADRRRIGALATYSGATGLITPGVTNALAGNGILYAGNQIPDIVAALRVEQGWGAVQLMGALHEIRAFDTGTAAAMASVTGVPTISQWGYAIGAGVRLNLDQFAKGDVFWLQGVYSNGAVNYAFQNTDSDGNPNMRNNFILGFNTLNARYADAQYTSMAGGSGIAPTTAWSIFSGFRHFFTPSTRAGLFGGYVNVDSQQGAAALATGLNDFQFWTVGANILYSPVRDLDLGLEIGYRGITTQNADGSPRAAVIGVSPGTGETNLYGTVRIQRNF